MILVWECLRLVRIVSSSCDWRECVIEDVVDEVVVVLKDRVFFVSVWGGLLCEVVKGVRSVPGFVEVLCGV